jgi:hypothetical protein
VADRRLYVADKRATYAALAPIIGGPIDFRIIEENWHEVLRNGASIRAGTTAPSALLRRLAAYPRQNAQAKTLREIGRLERTFFITLDWISDPALQRRANAGLNKGEAHHALKRAVFFHRLGEIRNRAFENQQHRISGLNLAVAAITLGIRYISPAPSSNSARTARSSAISCSPTSLRSAGSISPSMVTTCGRQNRCDRSSDPCEIPARPFSKLLNVRYGTDSAMTPVGLLRNGVVRDGGARAVINSLESRACRFPFIVGGGGKGKRIRA